MGDRQPERQAEASSGLLAQHQGGRAAFGQAQAWQLPQGLALQLQLFAPLLGQFEHAIQLQADPLGGQGEQQIETVEFATAAEQLAHRAPQQRGRAGPGVRSALARVEQSCQFLKELFAGPAGQQLLAKTAVAQQRGPQQLHQIATAAGIEQAEPARQFASGLLGRPAPVLELLQVDRQGQPVELQLKH